MIKKLLFTMAFAGGLYGAMAQCTPDESNTDLVSVPEESVVLDGTTYLPPIAKETAYEAVVQIYVPEVIESTVGDITVSKLKLNGIGGLPQGLSYECDNGDCTWEAMNNGCIRIYGTVPSSEADGKHDLTLQMGGSTLVGGVEIDVPQETVTAVLEATTKYAVHIGNNISVAENAFANKFALLGNVPNPFSVSTDINFSMPQSGVVEMKVYDLLGNVVSVQQMEAEAGENSFHFEANGLNSGIYMYGIDNGANMLTGRMIINQ